MTVAESPAIPALPKIADPKFRTIHQQKVDAFMRLAGQELPDSPTIPPADVRVLRARLILEEAFELIEKGLGINIKCDGPAFGTPGPFLIRYQSLSFDPKREPDLVEILDGAADVAVVTTGTLSACGLAGAYPQDLVDENNLAKFGPGSYRREDGKLIKPPGHQPPDIISAINAQLAPDAE